MVWKTKLIFNLLVVCTSMLSWPSGPQTCSRTREMKKLTGHQIKKVQVKNGKKIRFLQLRTPGYFLTFYFVLLFFGGRMGGLWLFSICSPWGLHFNKTAAEENFTFWLNYPARGSQVHFSFQARSHKLKKKKKKSFEPHIYIFFFLTANSLTRRNVTLSPPS